MLFPNKYLIEKMILRIYFKKWQINELESKINKSLIYRIKIKFFNIWYNHFCSKKRQNHN